MPSRSARPCRQPGCPALVRGKPRCPEHTRQHERARPSRHERGYGNAWDRISAQVLERDGYACFYCGGPATTADHVISKARGGTDDMDNLVAACVPCNSRKGAR